MRLLVAMVVVIVLGGLRPRSIANSSGSLASRGAAAGTPCLAARDSDRASRQQPRRRDLGGRPRRLVESLRDLIRIPSVNPPDPAGPELAAARYLAGALDDAGLPAEVLEPVPGRGSVVARLRGDGTGGKPLLLLVAPGRRARAAGALDPRPVRGDVADG